MHVVLPDSAILLDHLSLVVIGLLYMAYSDGRWHALHSCQGKGPTL